MNPQYSCKQQKHLPGHKSQHFPFPWPAGAIVCIDQWGKNIFFYEDVILVSSTLQFLAELRQHNYRKNLKEEACRKIVTL